MLLSSFKFSGRLKTDAAADVAVVVAADFVAIFGAAAVVVVAAVEELLAG